MSKIILFQGDSVTDAARSRENDSNLGVGYATLVKGVLSYEFPQQYVFYNRGIGGNRVIDLYARIKEDIINIQPDILSILIGVNDVLRVYKGQSGVTENKSYKVYSMLIEEIKEALPEVKILILEPFVLKASATEEHWEEIRDGVRKRAEIARKIADKYNLVFVELQDKFDEIGKMTSNDYWLVDGVHPTTAGHELIKREWLKVFEKF